MALKCVPLNMDWTGGTKLDMRAIYKRPSGDLTSALPLRRHANWVGKGLEYVTLADAESLGLAAKHGLINPQQYVAGYDGDGRPTPWNPEAYLEDVRLAQIDADAELLAKIKQFGVETVEQITGKPIPAHLKAQLETKKSAKVPA